MNYLQRINGVLELEDYTIIKECHPMDDGINCLNWFQMNGKNYLFKCGTLEEAYREVFWSYVLSHLKINAVRYDLAKQNGLYGVITEDVNPKRTKIQPLKSILLEYRQKVLYQKDARKYYYSLEELKQVYRYTYQNNYGDTEIEELIKATLQKFIIQILFGDSDMNYKNTTIITAQELKLFPYYDFGRFGRVKLNRNKDINFCFTYKQPQSELPINTLKDFFRFASQEEKEIFIKWMNLVLEINTNAVIEEMEEHIEHQIFFPLKTNLENQLKRNAKKAEKEIRRMKIY